MYFIAQHRSRESCLLILCKTLSVTFIETLLFPFDSYFLNALPITLNYIIIVRRTTITIRFGSKQLNFDMLAFQQVGAEVHH